MKLGDVVNDTDAVVVLLCVTLRFMSCISMAMHANDKRRVFFLLVRSFALSKLGNFDVVVRLVAVGVYFCAIFFQFGRHRQTTKLNSHTKWSHVVWLLDVWFFFWENFDARLSCNWIANYFLWLKISTVKRVEWTFAQSTRYAWEKRCFVWCATFFQWRIFKCSLWHLVWTRLECHCRNDSFIHFESKYSMGEKKLINFETIYRSNNSQ